MSMGAGTRALGDLERELPAAPSPPSAHRVYAPSALGGDIRRFWSLCFTLARTEFKLRFYGSVLGYVWTLVRPLLLFGVLWVVFTQLANVNGHNSSAQQLYPRAEEFRGAQLLASVILFTFFMEATAGAVRSVVDRENLVRKIRFPRLAIPASMVLLALFNLGLNLVVVLLFALGEGVQPSPGWLLILPLVAALVVLAAGVAMLLSALYVHFRDVQPIWDVVIQVLMYASPIIISLPTVLDHFSHAGGATLPAGSSSFSRFLYDHHFLFNIYMLNPLATIFQEFRHAVITPATPSPEQAIGGWATPIGSLALIVAIFVVGFAVFNRAAARIAENL